MEKGVCRNKCPFRFIDLASKAIRQTTNDHDNNHHDGDDVRGIQLNSLK
jgi:hypothetical protein